MVGPKDGPPATPAVEELVAHLQREIELLRGLQEALAAQRGAIAAGEAAAVNGNVEAISRIVLSIEEAHERRGRCLAALPGAPANDLQGLEAALGSPIPDRLEILRAELRRQAQEVTRSARINQKVLTRTMEAGEAFLMTLFSAVGEPGVSYGATPGAAAKPRSAGVLLNRTA
jgi:hypothetical protein